MNEYANGTTTNRVGSNAPAFVSRLIMFGYYDGATDGVVEFGPVREAYRFEWVDAESPTPATLRRRTYRLRPMPSDALDRLAAALAPYMAPKWPHWFPMWRFPSEGVRRDVEARTDAILAEAGPPAWQITTENPYDLTPFTATHLEPLAVTPD